MKSRFTLKEIAEMLNMSTDEVGEEIDNGHLSYSFENGAKQVTLYDLEKYMGEEQTQKITRDYLRTQGE